MGRLESTATMLGDGRMSFGDVGKQGLHVLWTDLCGITHECSGNEVHPGIVLIWTLCDRDVPANAAHVSEQAGDCEHCLASLPSPPDKSR
jgi:hypothetical protein